MIPELPQLLDLDVEVLQAVYASLSNQDQREDFVKSLGFTLADSSSPSARERRLQRLVQYETERTTQVHCLFREETVVSGILREYSRRLCKSYLARVLAPLANALGAESGSPESTSPRSPRSLSLASSSSAGHLVSSGLISLSASASPVLSVSSRSSKRGKGKSRSGSKNSTAPEEETLVLTQILLDSIFDSVPLMPNPLTALCHYLCDASSSKFPNSKNLVLSGFLFLRLYSPALLDPQFFLSSVPNRNSTKSEKKEFEKRWEQLKTPLLLVLKTIQRFANEISTQELGSDSNASPSNDSVLQQLVKMHSEGLRRFFDDVLMEGGTTARFFNEEDGGVEWTTSGPPTSRPSEKATRDYIYYSLRALRKFEATYLFVDRKLRKEGTVESARRREELKRIVATRPTLEAYYESTVSRSNSDLSANITSRHNKFKRTQSTSSLSSDEGSSSGSIELLRADDSLEDLSVFHQSPSPSPNGSHPDSLTTSPNTSFGKLPLAGLNLRRTKPLAQWTVSDVQKWAEAHSSRLGEQTRAALMKGTLDGKQLTGLTTHSAVDAALGLSGRLKFVETVKLKSLVKELLEQQSSCSSSSP